MKNIFLSSVFSAFLAFSANASQQYSEKILEYIRWIESKTEYVYNGEPLPKIENVAAQQLYLDVFGSNGETQYRLNPTSLMAYYNEVTDTIFLRDDIDFEVNPETQYIILHELVHYMQDINDNLDQCPGNNEKEAHDLHHLWTVENENVTEQKTDSLFLHFVVLSCNENFRDF